MLLDLIKKRKLQELFNLTAAAFRQTPADISGVSFEEGLAIYAASTKEYADEYIAKGLPGDKVKRRLYKGAYRFGRKFRRTLLIGTWIQSKAVLSLLYKMIGIDLSFVKGNRFFVRRCFFAKYYSPGVCRIISALDAGLAAGLSNGGKFRFTYRITEGRDCCMGTFEKNDAFEYKPATRLKPRVGIAEVYSETGYNSRKRRRRRNGGKGTSRQI